MGRQRSQLPPQRSSETSPESSAEAAVSLTLIQSTGLSQTAFVAALAPLLLAFLPRALFGVPEIAGEIAQEVAKLLYETEAVPIPKPGFARTMVLEAVSYRAAYVKAAVSRLSRAVLDAEPDERNEALRKALKAERRHLAAHEEMTRKRMAGARIVDGLVELHGPILGWRHAEKRIPTEPRPNHVAANAKNWDTRRGVPLLAGALPGVLPFCTCGAVAPYPGAEMIL